MVEYVDSPLMQFPVILGQAAESRRFFREALPLVLAGLMKLSRDEVDVICVDKKCPERNHECHYHK